VEFVSANPTGPITVASARGAAFGDSLSRILELAGNEVEREYYVNDAGTQVRKFGEAIRARARGEEPEEYGGEYVRRLAEQIEGAADADPDELARRGIQALLEGVESTLARFRVHMDRYFHESSLHSGGAVEAVLRRLDGVYDSEGATWLRTSASGDDKDRVLRRSNGDLTYFATDIAYHADKLARAYDHSLNVLGSDHHGYIKRMYAAWLALGGDPDAYEIVIMQLVHLLEGGQPVQMSKRAGTIVTLDDLIDAIGIDAAPASTWIWLWRASSRRTTPCTTCSTRTRGSPRSCARPARNGRGLPPRRTSAPAASSFILRPARSSSACSSFRLRCGKRPPAARLTG